MASNTPKQARETLAVIGKFPKPPTKRERDALYRPYALAIGNLLLSWNSLHEETGHLFGNILSGNKGLVAMAAWHVLKNDALQRDMLKSVCEAAPHTMFGVTKREGGFARRDDILWLVDEVNKLRSIRDDAIHAPLLFVISPKRTYIAPAEWRGNKRAVSLAKRDMMRAFLYCDQRANALRDYASQMHRALSRPEQVPWPGRPAPINPSAIRIPDQFQPRTKPAPPRQSSPR